MDIRQHPLLLLYYKTLLFFCASVQNGCTRSSVGLALLNPAYSAFVINHRYPHKCNVKRRIQSSDGHHFGSVVAIHPTSVKVASTETQFPVTHFQNKSLTREYIPQRHLRSRCLLFSKHSESTSGYMSVTLTQLLASLYLNIATAPSAGRSRYYKHVGSDWSWCCRDTENSDTRGYEVSKPWQTRDILAQSLWRNGIARWTSNPEAPGSSPGRDESLCVPIGRPAVTFDDDGDVLVADYCTSRFPLSTT